MKFIAMIKNTFFVFLFVKNIRESHLKQVKGRSHYIREKAHIRHF